MSIRIISSDRSMAAQACCKMASDPPELTEVHEPVNGAQQMIARNVPFVRSRVAASSGDVSNISRSKFMTPSAVHRRGHEFAPRNIGNVPRGRGYARADERHVPGDHLLRSIDRFVDLGELRRI